MITLSVYNYYEYCSNFKITLTPALSQWEREKERSFTVFRMAVY